MPLFFMDGPLEPRTLGAGDCVQFELIAIARADPVVLVDALYTYLLPAPAKKNNFVPGLLLLIAVIYLAWAFYFGRSSRSQLLGVNATGIMKHLPVPVPTYNDDLLIWFRTCLRRLYLLTFASVTFTTFTFHYLLSTIFMCYLL